MIRTTIENNKEYIIKKYNEGKSTVIIGKEFKCSPKYINTLLREWKTKIRTGKKFKGKIEDYTDEILRLYDEGLSSGKIGKVLGICCSSINEYLIKIGQDTTRYKCKDITNLLEPKKDDVIKLWKDGKSCGEIAKIVHNNNRSIARLLNREGFKTSQDLYELDENYFDKIDTPEKAYIFGFILADGCITQGKLSINLQEGDKEILDYMAKAFKYTGPLCYKVSKIETWQNQWMLTICRKEFVEKLKSLGCPERKSLILEFPTSVPDYFMSHFLRGSIDGDGTVQKWHIALTGSYLFTLGAQKKLEEFGISSYIHQMYKDRKPMDSCHQMYISRKENYHKFLRWLYKDATIFLNRKARKALEVLPDLGIVVSPPIS